MVYYTKKYKKFFPVFLVLFIVFSALSLTGTALANSTINFTPQVSIGNFTKDTSVAVSNSTAAYYIKAIYQYAVGSVGILATVVMMLGGVMWITAGGNPERIGNAKSWILAALTGLILALTSYMILYLVNPKLVSFEPLGVYTGDELTSGCCEWDTKSDETYCATALSAADCKKTAGDYTYYKFDTNTTCGSSNICEAKTSEDEDKASGCCQHYKQAALGYTKSCNNVNLKTDCVANPTEPEAANYPQFKSGESCVATLCRP